MKIAADTLEDPNFPMESVSLLVVNYLPLTVITQEQKQLLSTGSFTLNQVCVLITCLILIKSQC